MELPENLSTSFFGYVQIHRFVEGFFLNKIYASHMAVVFWKKIENSCPYTKVIFLYRI